MEDGINVIELIAIIGLLNRIRAFCIFDNALEKILKIFQFKISILALRILGFK